MIGTEELRKLAALMRICADTARKIADARGEDKTDIYALARRADELAEGFEAIGLRPLEGPDLN